MLYFKQQRQCLAWFDIVILTMIFFGQAIYTSTLQYISLLQTHNHAPENLEFGTQENLDAMLFESVLLIIVFMYLLYRRFDFSQLNLKFDKTILLKTIIYIVLVGITVSVAEYGYYFFSVEGLPKFADYTDGNGLIFEQISLSLIFFALLNGFFEELFFLGLIFCIKKPLLPYAIAFSLLVRFSFHTYQGLFSAMIISIFGITFLLLRLKNKELLPFMLAHAFFDVFGLSVIWYLT